MIKKFVRATAILLIAVCATLGFYTVRFYSISNSDIGIRLVCLLYEYDSIEDIEGRMDQLRNLTSPDVYSQLNITNDAHYTAAYGRTGSYPTGVKIVFDRPGLIVYALDNAKAYPSDLWCFEYKIEDGVFTEVREYKLVGWRTDSEGGLFRAQ